MENNLTSSIVSRTARLFKQIRCVNSRIEDRCCIGDYCDIDNSILYAKSELGRFNIVRDSTIGKGTYTGSNCIIKHADVGKYTSIAWNVNIGAGNSHSQEHVSMYSDYWFNRTFGVELSDHDSLDKGARTIIGNDVWIGMGAIILHGLTIGDGAIIGAGALVNKDVAPYSVVVGVPAKPIKQRFEEQIIELLLELKWWEWSERKIVENVDLLRSEPTIEVLQRFLEDSSR